MAIDITVSGKAAEGTSFVMQIIYQALKEYGIKAEINALDPGENYNLLGNIHNQRALMLLNHKDELTKLLENKNVTIIEHKKNRSAK